MRKSYSQPRILKLNARAGEGQRLKVQIDGSDRRQTTRIMVQIPVQVHFQNSDGLKVSVEAFTIEFNLHGCLLAMDVKPDDGQRLRIQNVKSAVQHSGQVIHSHRSRDGSFVVACEFDSPAPGFWSVLTQPQAVS